MNTALLILPESFWLPYEKVLVDLDLFDECLEETGGGIYGGKGNRKTNEHFAKRCSNSCSRTAYILKSGDPRVDKISSSTISTLTSDTVAIVDLAAGTGGGMYGVLSSIEELRTMRNIPCLPLNLHIFAADYSQESLDIYEKMFEELQPNLKKVGIDAVLCKFLWDASDVTQSVALCDCVKKNDKIKECLIIVSALSGIKKNKLDDLKRSFSHILESFSGYCCTSMWIEPGGDSGLSFLKKAKKMIYCFCEWLMPSSKDNEVVVVEYKWFHKLQKKELSGSLSMFKYHKINML
jgi:hypothetical protein